MLSLLHDGLKRGPGGIEIFVVVGESAEIFPAQERAGRNRRRLHQNVLRFLRPAHFDERLGQIIVSRHKPAVLRDHLFESRLGLGVAARQKIGAPPSQKRPDNVAPRQNAVVEICGLSVVPFF